MHSTCVRKRDTGLDLLPCSKIEKTLALENYNKKSLSQLVTKSFSISQHLQYLSPCLHPFIPVKQSLFVYDSFLILRNTIMLPFFVSLPLVFPTLITWRHSCQTHFVWFQLCHVLLEIICSGLVSFLLSTSGQRACLYLNISIYFLFSHFIFIY